MYGALRLPTPFADAAAESEFLIEYRLSGLRLAKIAFVIAALMALAFWIVVAIAPTAAQVSLSRQSARLALCAVLAGAAAYLHFWEPIAIRSFRGAVGAPMAVACLVVGAMGMVPLDSGSLEVNRFPVAMCLTCWLCYGFTRLPTSFVALSCFPASLLTLLGSSLQGDDHVLALAIYLSLANLIGWIMSVEIERRERALFWSSRQLAGATKALGEMARSAAEADAAKTRVLAAVSHDLRQPLASLSLYAKLLRGRNDVLAPAGLDVTVERLDACVSALSGNLDRLSELGGLRDRQAPLPVERVDLNRLLERVESVYSAEAARRGVRLLVRRPAPACRFALSNENRLWDIVSNLTANALKFSSRERAAWVSVRVRRRGEGLAIEVRDNGIGIASADQRRVFDEYFQVANHARNSEHGHGLGLSIVRETVSRLPGHTIELASRPGRGTLFALRLPVADAVGGGEVAPAEVAPRGSVAADAQGAPRSGLGLRASAQRCESPPARYVAGGRDGDDRVGTTDPRRGARATERPTGPPCGAYVLFIEDDDSMRDALGQMLEQWGILVDAVASGEEALRLAADAQRSFDAIVSDYRLLGEWNGLRLIEELRRLEGRRTPAILLSGEFAVEALRRDAPEDVHIMAKPPDVPLLHGLLTAFAGDESPARA